MAEEEVLGEEEATAEEESTEESEGGGLGSLLDFGGGMMDSMVVKLLTGAIVLVAIVLIVIGVSHYMMEALLVGTTPGREDPEVDTAQPTAGREPMETMELEGDFMVAKENPRTNRMRTIKITIHLGFRDGASALRAELQSRMPQIRDRIYSILGSKSYEELDYENLPDLKDDIRTEINTLLVSEYRVQEVFFSDLMIQ